MQTKGSLMETEKVTANPANVADIGRENTRNSMLHAVAVFVIRCALASLSRWTRPQRQSPAKEIHRTKAVNGARMAFATFDQQLQCDCSSCTCELLVTAFREDLVFVSPITDADCSPKFKHFCVVCEPFTPAEIALLDANDEEYIRSAYPGLAAQVQKEINDRNNKGFLTEGRQRGLFCTAATRH
jgi:hypothetical protein